MACDAFERRILDYVEQQLPAAERPALETHLAECADCRAFARQLRQLDAALAQGVRAPVLPSNFSERLRDRIHAEEPVRMPEAQRAERKRQLEAEFEAVLARSRARRLGLANLFESLGWVVLAALAGWLVVALAPTWANVAAQIGLGRFGQSLVLSCALAAVFLFIGLEAAFPQPFRRVWRAV